MASPIGFGAWAGWWNHLKIAWNGQAATEASWAEQYDFLRAYYLSNGLYEVLREKFSGLNYSDDLIRPLRNPAYRVVEFYAAKLWPGSLETGIPIVAKKRQKQLSEVIEQIHAMSNWATEKQAVARNFPMYGDVFLKVATRSSTAGQIERVFIQNLEPQTVTEFDADERSYLTYIRLDIPQTRRMADGKTKPYMLTEVWDKSTMLFRRWEHERGIGMAIEGLGTPIEERRFAEFGIDFVPVVWAPFRHIGEQRGMAAITPAIDKIDEANRQATRLHTMAFRYNKPVWALMAGGMDSSGRPLPAPRLSGTDGKTLQMASDPNKDDILPLPGSSTLAPLVPALDYASVLELIRDQMVEIRRDLPEMAYSELQEQSNLSGIALRYMLEAAVDRCIEVRGNLDAALVRAHQIAMTIGSKAGLFQGLGTFEQGAFDHQIGDRPILSLGELDRAGIVKAYFDADIPLITAARRAGWTEDDIAQMKKDKVEEDEAKSQNIATALLNAQDRFDRGAPVEQDGAAQDEEVEDGGSTSNGQIEPIAE